MAIGVGTGEDDGGILESGKVIQEVLELREAVDSFEGDGVEGDQENFGAEKESEGVLEFLPGHQGGVYNDIDGGVADVEYHVRSLPHLDDALAVGFGGGKMDVSHFGDGVAECVVECALGDFAAADMGNGDIGEGGGEGGGKDFEAVAEYGYDMRGEFCEGFAESGHGDSGGAGEGGGGVGIKFHIDFSGDVEAVGLDFAQGHAEFFGEVGSGDEQLEFEIRGLFDHS